MVAFLSLFWRILIEQIISEKTSVDSKNFFTEFLITLFDLHRLSDKQAEAAFDLFLDFIEVNKKEMEGEENQKSKKIFPKILRKQIKSMIVRFPNSFDLIRKRRNKLIIQKLMEECKVSNLIVGN
uniref:Uncharacterized protein n=1 Tax=Meloidogyne incognita TaxID=6306 RepID=A0A914LPI8_MELIC